LGDVVGLQAGSDRGSVLAPSTGRQVVEDMPLVVFHGLAEAAARCIEVSSNEGSRRSDLRACSLLIATTGKVVEVAGGSA
jgi:hypothetical protein